MRRRAERAKEHGQGHRGRAQHEDRERDKKKEGGRECVDVEEEGRKKLSRQKVERRRLIAWPGKGERGGGVGGVKEKKQEWLLSQNGSVSAAPDQHRLGHQPPQIFTLKCRHWGDGSN